MTLSTKLVDRASAALEKRFSRRSFVGRTAVVGAAVTVGGLDFVLKPTPAYASVCGPGTGCATGWTAMCCTINDGINACPPGSFAGGWWKADGASLCGGQARYIVDCQGECTGCGCSGSSFCAEGCWNCQRHCASGTCDDRRVCWNVFRYGQCHQEIGCGGPVLCRMITCVPPWRFLPCTTDVATDNNTTDHNAPCLAPWSAIQAAYKAIGGAGSPLGYTVNGEYAVSGGTAQNLTNARYYSSGVGTWFLYGKRVAAFDAAGGVAALGFPTEYQRYTPDRGIVQNLQRGAIYSTTNDAVGVVLTGAVLTAYRSFGETTSPLGYPTAAQVANGKGTGVHQAFQQGAIYTTTTGAFEVWGAVYRRWVAAGAEKGTYGLPTKSVVQQGTRQYGTFEGGTISVGTAPRTLRRS